MVEQKQTTLTPDMIEGNIIRSVQIISGGTPLVVMELEDRNEQQATLTIIPSAQPMLNGNLLCINPSITLNLNKKEKS